MQRFEEGFESLTTSGSQFRRGFAGDCEMLSSTTTMKGSTSACKHALLSRKKSRSSWKDIAGAWQSIPDKALPSRADFFQRVRNEGAQRRKVVFCLKLFRFYGS